MLKSILGLFIEDGNIDKKREILNHIKGGVCFEGKELNLIR
jgi:hypothetical protein